MRALGINTLPASVHCVGHHSFMEIPMWLAAADILLVLGTKRNEYSYLHTSPMKCFEYMASKRPIVASATPANREIVDNPEALLYEPDNPHDLAEKINYAVSHKDEMKARANRAFTKVQNFSWDKRGNRIRKTSYRTCRKVDSRWDCRFARGSTRVAESTNRRWRQRLLRDRCR